MKSDKRDNKTMSKVDNVENIDSLTSVVQKIEASFRFWHDWSNWLIVATLIAGACLYFFQYKATETAILLGKSKDKLSEHKDSEQALQIDNVKRDSEENIARVKADAEKQIALLNTESMKAKEEIAKAQVEVAKANEKAEAERLERMRLEAELAPRTLEQRQSAKELLKFQGINVIIESLAESESWRTAGQIAWTLDNAKWNILPDMKRFLDATHFFDGVAIETNVGARPREDRSKEVANALVEILAKNNIEAHRRPSGVDLPLNTIKIRVGLKPATYFQRNRKDLEYGNMLYK